MVTVLSNVIIISKKNCTEEFLTFIRNEKSRSEVMTNARIQPFCRKNNINIGCFKGKETSPRNITERNIFLFKHNFHFCLFWKSNVLVSLKQW